MLCWGLWIVFGVLGAFIFYYYFIIRDKLKGLYHAARKTTRMQK